MAFQIIYDPDVAREYAAANLLWRVSQEDGGTSPYPVLTCPYGPSIVASHVYGGCCGIHIQE